MQTFRTYVSEAVKFNNWVQPTKEQLTHEYKIEYEIKSLKNETNDAWPSLNDFLKSAKQGKVITVTPAMDKTISYRSHTKSKQALISLIKSYASYPKYRNEKTVESIYTGFENGDKMPMPIVLQFPNGRLKVMGGNTRADVAMQTIGKYKALLIQVPDV